MTEWRVGDNAWTVADFGDDVRVSPYPPYGEDEGRSVEVCIADGWESEHRRMSPESARIWARVLMEAAFIADNGEIT